ncbi:MAG: hypothetical protein AAB494_01265 [Patescibacteria group bacterium]
MRWLSKIRHSNEEKKKKMIVFLSAVSMVVVIFFWIWYMSSYIKEVGTSKTDEARETPFWPVFKNGATVIIQSIKYKFSELTSDLYSKIPKIGGERVINIQNQ